jgi:hypothetical protein
LPTVTVEFLPLDPHIHAVIVETSDEVHIGLDPSDPAAASRALAALLQERFDSGAWVRPPIES